MEEGVKSEVEKAYVSIQEARANCSAPDRNAEVPCSNPSPLQSTANSGLLGQRHTKNTYFYKYPGKKDFINGNNWISQMWGGPGV